MKKIFTIIICLAFVSTVFSQERKSSWGVKASFNIATITGGDSKTTKTKPGFNAGIVSEFRLNKLVALSPELLYSTQGVREEAMGLKASLTSSYINLPIMVKFYVTKKFSLEVGPQFGYMVHLKATVKDLSAKVEKSQYNAFDASWGIGATYNFSRLFMSARYNMGYTNVLKNNDVSNHNRVFQIGLGCKF